MTRSSLAVAATPDEERVESVASSETTKAPAPKKARTSTTSARKTVFHLSRLNKRFWKLLRSDTDAMLDLWERARWRSGIPRLLAPGCNVYQYANVLFGFCRGCGKPTTKVDYVLRIRACPKCYRTFVTDRKGAACDQETLRLTPKSHYDSNGSHRQNAHYLRSELETVSSMINEVEHTRKEAVFLQKTCPKDILPRDDSGEDSDPDINPDDPDWHLWDDIQPPAFLKCNDLAYLALVDTKEDFIYAFEDIQALRDQDANDIFAWFVKQEERKKAELEQLNLQRRQAIEARFLEAGWLPQHFTYRM